MVGKESTLARTTLSLGSVLALWLCAVVSGQTTERVAPQSEEAETAEPQEFYSDTIVVEAPADTLSTHSAFQASSEPSATINSPGNSAAETLQRLPGVVVSRDRGQADGILVRGAQSRLVATNLDGERLPSSDGASRSAGLGMVPLELLETATVSKIYSPDREADAIGATVDLVTRRLPAAGIRQWTLAAGQEHPDGGHSGVADVTFGQRYLGGTLGTMITLGTNDSESHPDRIDRRFGDGSDAALEQLDLRDFTLSEQRDGALVRFDWQPNEQTDLNLRGFWNRLTSDESRRRAKIDFEDAEIERELKKARLVRQITSVRATGSHVFDDSLGLDYAATFTDARQNEPFRVDTAFVAEGLEGISAEDAAFADPDLFFLSEVGTEANSLLDTTSSLAINVFKPLQDSARMKSGFKIRYKERRQDQNTTLFEPSSRLSLSDFLDPQFSGEDFARGQFRLGPVFDPATDVFSSNFQLMGRRSFEEDAADYTATEQVAAGYVLVDWEMSPHALISAGVRFEHTDTEYSGNEVLAGESEEESVLSPLQGGRSYNFIMPSMSLVLDLGDGLLLRSAVSRTFARPDYVDLVPFELVDLEDEEIETGNPLLDVTSSWNYDAAIEWNFSSGNFALGAFYKSLQDFTFRARSEELRDGDMFDVSQPRSGETAELLGLELTLGSDFNHWLPGFSAELHLTLTDSKARFGALTRERLRLPGQAAYSGNLLLSHHKGRFSNAIALSFTDDYLLDLGQRRDEDLYVDQELRLDLAGDVDLGKGWNLFWQAKNLTDEVSLIFQGQPERTYRQDFSGRSFTLGVRHDW